MREAAAPRDREQLEALEEKPRERRGNYLFIPNKTDLLRERTRGLNSIMLGTSRLMISPVTRPAPEKYRWEENAKREAHKSRTRDGTRSRKTRSLDEGACPVSGSRKKAAEGNTTETREIKKG